MMEVGGWGETCALERAARPCQSPPVTGPAAPPVCTHKGDRAGLSDEQWAAYKGMIVYKGMSANGPCSSQLPTFLPSRLLLRRCLYLCPCHSVTPLSPPSLPPNPPFVSPAVPIRLSAQIKHLGIPEPNN